MKLNKEIIRLTLPAVVSNITVPLLGLSDTAISGRLGSEIFIGAIAVGTMMFNVVFWLFGFLRMGTTGLTAQAFGASDKERCKQLFSRSIALSIAVGFLLILLQYPIGKIMLWLISPSAEVSNYANMYFKICVWGAPAVLVNMSVMGWFLGMQNTLYPMIISISINIINILMSIYFVFVCDMGFEGVAYGTLIANYMGVILALLFVRKFEKGKMPISSIREIMHTKELKRFFKVNTDIFFRSACIMSVSLSITAFGAQIGTMTLAANAVIMQFFVLFSYFMDGLAFTGEALTGRFIGANDSNNLWKSIRLLLIWSSVMAIIFMLAYLLFHNQIVEFIAPDEKVVRCVEQYVKWFVPLPIVAVAAFIFDGIFIGLTATRKMLVVTFVSTILFYLICQFNPFASNNSDAMANDSLWMAFLSYLFLRGVLLMILLPPTIKKSLSSRNCINVK